MDLDPDKVANSMSEAAIQAEILKKFQEANPPEQPQEGAEGAQGGVTPQGPAGGSQGAPQAPTGGTPAGGMNVGGAPTPGEQGFSGNTGPQ